jgi:hypothetical protein
MKTSPTLLVSLALVALAVGVTAVILAILELQRAL